MEGTRIGNFTLQRRLGEGGMATVWYAENHIGKRAAVKLLNPALGADPGLRDRFEQEARIMAQLEHPHIRQVYDFDAEQLAIVMEYLEGEDLAQVVARRGGQPEAQVRVWLQQVLPAFAKAHAAGIIHRDVKPSNLFLTEEGMVKILDFGIAKVTEGDGPTRTGRFIGSPMYASPEQIDDPKRVDLRTDLYSLGVTAWTLLSGSKPFDDSSGSEYRIYRQVIEAPLGTLSTCSPSFNQWLQQLTAKRPADRFPDAQTALATLSGHAGSVTIASAGAETTRIDSARPVVSPSPPPRRLTVNGQELSLPEMVWVPGGRFEMGSAEGNADEKPVHTVTLEGFWLGKYPVTNAEYAMFLQQTQPNQEQVAKYINLNGGYLNTSSKIVFKNGKYDCIHGFEDYPVAFVSYWGSGAFAAWLREISGLNWGLPSEVQWEYAACGGPKVEPSSNPNQGQKAWTRENSNGGPQKVGIKEPNELGIFDMIGNVWEWCTPTNQFQDSFPLSNSSSVPSRGGSWITELSNTSPYARQLAPPNLTVSSIGFRVAV